jgi:hypothetical protein
MLLGLSSQGEWDKAGIKHAVGDMRNLYRVLVRKLEAKSSGRSGRIILKCI